MDLNLKDKKENIKIIHLEFMNFSSCEIIIIW